MSHQWYVARDGQQYGPYSSEQLAEEARAGRLVPTDRVWREGLKGWISASLVRGLFPPIEAPPIAVPPVRIHQAGREVYRDAEGAFWFLDLGLKRYITPWILRIIWWQFLAGFVWLVLSFVYGILRAIMWSIDGAQPVWVAIEMQVAAITSIIAVGVVLWWVIMGLLLVRVVLEMLMLAFNVAVDVRSIRDATVATADDD